QQACQNDDQHRARKLLDGLRPEHTSGEDLRGLEWYYWSRVCPAELLTREDRDCNFFGLCFSPDGTRLAGGHSWLTRENPAPRLGVWAAGRGQQLLPLSGHSERVNAAAFSPDGTRLATASHDTTVKVWDARSGQALLTLKGNGAGVKSVCFSPDGARL